MIARHTRRLVGKSKECNDLRTNCARRGREASMMQNRVTTNAPVAERIDRQTEAGNGLTLNKRV